MDDRQLVVRMIAYMERKLAEPLDMDGLARHAGYSPNRLRQKFFRVMGDTPSGYLRKRKLTEAAKEILGGGKIVEVSLKYGYSSQDNFTTAFRSYFGVPPGELSRIDAKYKLFISRLREEFSIMEVANLHQPPFCSTLMGCVKGAADYFDYDLSQAQLFGLTGHAFLINIHEDLCSGSPYNWDHKWFYALLENLGIRHEGSYRSTKETPLEERSRMEASFKAHLDRGELCMLSFMEHQLFCGYDETGFLLLQPWECQSEYEIKQLNYQGWDQCLETQGWVQFDLFERCSPRGTFRERLKEALRQAAVLYRSPEPYESPQCRIGQGAYRNWISFIEEKGGDVHGHWWNAMVWMECRRQGARFFQEIRELELVPSAEIRRCCASLEELFDGLADRMDQLKDRKLDDRRKVALLRECLGVEGEVIPLLLEMEKGL